MTAIRVIRMKMASTAACVTAKGGSVCVGANALRAETFTKLCTTKTKTLKDKRTRTVRLASAGGRKLKETLPRWDQALTKLVEKVGT
jgi:hypothetical protein